MSPTRRAALASCVGPHYQTSLPTIPASAAAVGCSNHEQLALTVALPSITCSRYPQLIETEAEASTAAGALLDRNMGPRTAVTALCRQPCLAGRALQVR